MPRRLKSSAFALEQSGRPDASISRWHSVPGFDWGLPFFFGRTVFTAIEDRGTPAGPYFAF
jgi:hypothetical protein